MIQRSRKPTSNKKRALQARKESTSKKQPLRFESREECSGPKKLCHAKDSEFQWYIPRKEKDSKGLLPLDERRNLVNSDIRDDASLPRVVTPPFVGIA
jgi:hypothetical protein